MTDVFDPTAQADPAVLDTGADLLLPPADVSEVPGIAGDPVAGDPATLLPDDADVAGVAPVLDTFTTGTWSGAFGVDDQTGTEVLVVSTTGSQQPDLVVTEDGVGGYLVQVDTDGDGAPDTEVDLTRAELEVQFPDLLGFLDAQFAGDGAEPGGIPDAGGAAEWTIEGGQLIGDPAGASEHWFEQAANGFCVPASITQIVAAYTGMDLDDESFFVQRANELHLFTVGPDGSPSMTVDGAAALLVDVGIDAHVESDLTILDLENYLDQGRAVMMAVDADEMWYAEDDAVDDAANHAVVLTGIDPVNGVAIISDPGSPTGNEFTMPISELDRMWEDSGRQAVVVDLPAPEMTSDAQQPVVDVDGMPAAEAGPVDTVAAAFGAAGAGNGADLLDQAGAGVAADAQGPFTGAVDWVVQHPFVIIPVVAAAGALTRRPR